MRASCWRVGSRWLWSLGLLAAISSPRPLRADDLADEADFLFQRGAEAYQKRDYGAALEHFLASNRLVPNRNVVFNIAFTYQKLQRYPEAYRYLTDALVNERDPSQIQRLEAALDVVRRHVGVIDVRTQPSFATLFLEREDLGPRGKSPRSLGVTPGTHQLIVQREGYYPESVSVADVGLGEQRQVEVTLRPILGAVRFTGPAGTQVTGDANCITPCSVSLMPGVHRFRLWRSGFRKREVTLTVLPEETSEQSTALDPLEGRLVVTSDVPGAQVEVNGRTAGFSPTVVTLPVGAHDVTILRSGYRPYTSTVAIQADGEQRLNAVMTQEEEVTAATRVRQRVAEAPSSVSIISREEIRAFRYPTLAEALRGVPGVYLSDDRSYESIGIRGVSRLGSYGNRVLVLSDGHGMNDNWIGSSYVGYDGRADLGDIERIEVVRGPGSVAYGTSAFSGVVNLETRPVSASQRLEFGLGTEADSVAMARVRAEKRFGENGSLWTSVAGGHGGGRDFYFSELARQGESSSAVTAHGVDGFDVATLAGRLTYGVFSAQWFWSTYDKHIPSGAYGTVLGDPRARQRDSRGLLELRAEPRIGDKVSWLSRAYLNSYRFHGAYPHPLEDGGVETDSFKGTWFGAEQRLRFEPSSRLRLLVGGELQSHFQVQQSARDESGTLLEDKHPFWVGAGYATLDAQVHPRLALHGGARLDAYSTFGSSLNPRVAVIFKPYAHGNWKLVAGKAFRAPSVYELYYNDGGFTQIPNEKLGPEHVYSTELEITHELSPLYTLTSAFFGNYVSKLIVATGGGREDDPLQYQNSRVPLFTAGGELGFRRELRQGFLFAASYGLVFARYLKDESAGSLWSLAQNPDYRSVANAPTHLATLKVMAPVVVQGMRIASRLTLESGRYDRYELVGEPAQKSTVGGAVWDVVLTGLEPRTRIGWAVGVYNAFDYRRSLPVSAEFPVRSMPQRGRTFLLSADIAF